MKRNKPPSGFKWLERWSDTYHNPYNKQKTPHTPFLPPYFREAPSNINTEQKAKKEPEYVLLDVGSGVLWCKFCARSKCPCFNEGGKEKTLDLIKRLTNTGTGQVVIDIFDPDHRWISSTILLSHVGCVSFSNVDLSHNKEIIPCIEDPEFLEIV